MIFTSFLIATLAIPGTCPGGSCPLPTQPLTVNVASPQQIRVVHPPTHQATAAPVLTFARPAAYRTRGRKAPCRAIGICR
jgi:hypothetical protein